MKFLSKFALVIVVLSIGYVVPSNAQTGEGGGVPIEIVLKTPQDSCSKDDLTCMNNGDPFISNPVRYDLRNISNKAIRSYVVVFDRRNERLIEIISYLADLPEKGKELYRAYTADRKEKVSISLDYIEFADGSTWGPDRLRKSKEIAAYWAGIDSAIQRLKDLVKNDVSSDYFIKRASSISASSWLGILDKDPDIGIERARASGYRQVVHLLLLESEGYLQPSQFEQELQKKAHELARKLELMDAKK